jgi:hypothetical protein
MSSALSRTLKTQRVRVLEGFWVHVDPISWEGSKTTKSHTFYDKKFFQLFCEPWSRDIKYKPTTYLGIIKVSMQKITKPKGGWEGKKKGQLESKNFIYFDKWSYLHHLKIKKLTNFQFFQVPQ